MKSCIEKGIAIPSAKTEGGLINEYPFKAMEVGDSFPVTGDEGKRVVSNAYNFGALLGMKFACRKLGPGSYRIWRVK
jgi:hypothetical protein